MPEQACNAFSAREINWYAHKPGIDNIEASGPREYGFFNIHRDICALATGNRQTTTFHISPLGDSILAPLPKLQRSNASETRCTACHEPKVSDHDPLYIDRHKSVHQIYQEQKLNHRHPADALNALKPTGELFCTVRGKELVLLIGEFAIRVCFGTEGHTFWIPTNQYQSIIASPTVKRGVKGTAFQVPPELIEGFKRTETLKVSIQAAFVRPQWTLLFVDHQVFITFHIFRLWRTGTAEDLEPSSKLYARLWSRSHGPVFLTEPAATLDVLDTFRVQLADQSTSDPIWVVMKSRQDVFNGFGAQETCDTLLTALIHPRMPAHLVCRNPALWSRLVDAVCQDHILRVTMPHRKSKPFPYVSSVSAFRFNTYGHTLFLHNVTCYRRVQVIFTRERLASAHALGLFNPDAVLDEDGVARLPSTFTVEQSVAANFRTKQTVRPDCTTVKVPNYGFQYPKYKSEASSGLVTMYSPFICRLPEDWPAHDLLVENIIDVSKCINETTLGPYSFQVFVDVAWSTQHLEKAKQVITAGRRAKKVISNGVTKRPRKDDVLTGQSSRSKQLTSAFVRYQPVQADRNDENVNSGAQTDALTLPLSKSMDRKRVLRSSTKLVNVNRS